jgi:ADP-ribose pyrophosphatase YjhB (NUDIX family)
MITFEKKGKTFTYRVAAVIVDHGRVLLQRTEGDHFWSLPGDKAEFQEQASDVIKRKMRDDLSEEVDIDRLLWVVENFFRDQKQEKQFHELGLIFLAHLQENSPYLIKNGSFLGEKGKNNLVPVFQWFAQDELELRKIPIYPLFLKYSLANLPNDVEHVINQDGSI